MANKGIYYYRVKIINNLSNTFEGHNILSQFSHGTEC